MNIAESIKRLIDVSEDRKIVGEFAREKYREKFFDGSKRVGFHYYDRFVILSETRIEIFFKYGVGEYGFDGSFVVDLIPEIRDDSIKSILD